jgi:hypothetical protein
MKWQRIEIEWNYYLPKARRHWLALSDSQAAAIKGDYQCLVECLREAYALAREDAVEAIHEWCLTFGEEEAASPIATRRTLEPVERLNARVMAQRRDQSRHPSA